MTAIRLVPRGASFEFVFSLDGESIEGWICTMEVREFQGDVALISRVIEPSASQWEGFLTAVESASLEPGLYRMLGHLTNATTVEEKQPLIRFRITGDWGS